MSDTVRVRRTNQVTIPAPALTASQRRRVGGEAIGQIHERVTQKHLGLNGSALPPYSTKGPIYIPITGPGRTKSDLGGRSVITSRDISKMRKRGVRIAGMRPPSGGYGARTSTTVDGGRTASGRSMKFANRAEYKRAMGKSGQRDLEETGQMLGSMTLTQNRPELIELGFTNEIAERKGFFNEEADPWFGLAPEDVPPVTAMVDGFLIENLNNSR